MFFEVFASLFCFEQLMCFLGDFVNASVCRTYEDSNVKFLLNVTKLLS